MALLAQCLFADTNMPLTAAEVAQWVELRSVLEVEAMRLACLRRSPDDLDRLQRILVAVEKRRVRRLIRALRTMCLNRIWVSGRVTLNARRLSTMPLSTSRVMRGWYHCCIA